MKFEWDYNAIWSRKRLIPLLAIGGETVFMDVRCAPQSLLPLPLPKNWKSGVEIHLRKRLIPLLIVGGEAVFMDVSPQRVLPLPRTGHRDEE